MIYIYNRRGFTLIELIIVIAVIALIAGAIFVAVDPAKRIGEAKNALRENNALALEKAIEKSIVENAVIPVNLASLSNDTYYMMVTEGSPTSGTHDCVVADKTITRADVVEDFKNFIGDIPIDDEATGNDTGYYVRRLGNSYQVGYCNKYNYTDPRYETAGFAAYWKLDESSTPSEDSSGNEISGTWVNGPTASTSVPSVTDFINNYSIEFGGDASNQYIDLGSVSNLDVFGSNQDFSIAMWIKRDSASQNHDMFFSCGSGSNSGILFAIDWNDASKMEFLSRNNSVNFASNAVMNSADWQHVAMTADRDGYLTFYLDGLDVGSTSIAATAAEDWNRTSGICKIANDRSDSNQFDGLIDDVRLYSKALSQSEITSLANGNRF